MINTSNKIEERIEKIKENDITILRKIEIDNKEQYADVMYTYQRLINNLIGAIGIIKWPWIYYPYFNRDKTWNIYIDSKNHHLTGIDIKTIDIHNVRKKIKDFVEWINDENIRKTLGSLTDEVEKRTIQYFQQQQSKEVEKKERHDTSIRFFGNESEQKGKRAIEALYNLVGEKRMEYFDYNKITHQCTLNKKWKEWLLNELYKEIDDITKYRFTNIEDIFPWSDYPQIKNKSITIDQIDNQDIIIMAEYLLAAHHSIDEMTELYSRINERTGMQAIKPIRNILKILLRELLRLWSSTTTITDIVDRHGPKAKSSTLKRNRWLFLERIIIAAPYLQNLYSFKDIEQVYNTCILPLEQNLIQQFPWTIKHVKTRLKSDFSRKNKLLRDKSITNFWDMIGIQIFIDSSKADRNQAIEHIFKYINEHIHNHTRKDQKIIIQNIQVDNKKIISPEECDNLIKSIGEDVQYTIQTRKKTKKSEQEMTRNSTDPILDFFDKWKTWSNGKWQDIKEIIVYQIIDGKGNTIDNMSGIEVQIMPHWVSINANEAAHEFLDTQKTIDLAINTNAVCPWEEYCRIKDVAITARAHYLNTTRKKIEQQKSSEYTKEMWDEERFYVIDINDINRDFINKVNNTLDPHNIIRIEKGKVYIDLTKLEELSSSIYKRHAADIIIMDQVNKELQGGKLIQYQYYDDRDKNNKLQEYIHVEPNSLNVEEGIYPRISDIQRDEKWEAINMGIHFINPWSKIRIQTGQTPKNAVIIVPDDDGEKGYAQNIAWLAYSLKQDNILPNDTKNQLAQVMQQSN